MPPLSRSFPINVGVQKRRSLILNSTATSFREGYQPAGPFEKLASATLFKCQFIPRSVWEVQLWNRSIAVC